MGQKIPLLKAVRYCVQVAVEEGLAREREREAKAKASCVDIFIYKYVCKYICQSLLSRVDSLVAVYAVVGSCVSL